MSTISGKKAAGFLLLAALLLFLAFEMVLSQGGSIEDGNPHANFWRVVRQGIAGFTTVSSEGHPVLIQNSGENWREVRNGLLVRSSPFVIAGVLLAIGLFYMRIGPDRLEKPRSGTLIQRYTTWERILHWYTAAVFIIMAVTGLGLLLGRIILIPLFGHPFVSGVLHASKVLHNVFGPLLLPGLLAEFVVWVRFNIPRDYDLQWFRNMGGMIGKGPRPHIGKVNAGEKGWFWLVFFFGIGVGVTGILLDFPVWGQSRLTLQLSHVIHVTMAVLFVAASLGHIYMGTLGVEGAFEAMWSGFVDAVWAQQQHDLWYEELMQKKRESPEAAPPEQA